jgi:hypothetical protein
MELASLVDTLAKPDYFHGANYFAKIVAFDIGNEQSD